MPCHERRTLKASHEYRKKQLLFDFEVCIVSIPSQFHPSVSIAPSIYLLLSLLPSSLYPLSSTPTSLSSIPHSSDPILLHLTTIPTPSLPPLILHTTRSHIPLHSTQQPLHLSSPLHLSKPKKQPEKNQERTKASTKMTGGIARRIRGAEKRVEKIASNLFVVSQRYVSK